MAQAEALAKAVSKFGASAKAKLGGGGQPEDQLRNPLETLVMDIAEEFSAASSLSSASIFSRKRNEGHSLFVVAGHHILFYVCFSSWSALVAGE